MFHGKKALNEYPSISLRLGVTGCYALAVAGGR